MKQCPYCGEDILAIAKKCKHCGEWLDGEDDSQEEVAKEEYYEEKSADNDSHLEFLINVLGVIILLAVAFFTCPSKEKQREKMMEELRVEMRKELRHNHQQIPQSNKRLDKLIEKRWNLYIDNYLIFNLGRLEEVDTEDKSFFSIGAFGFVYVRDLILH